MSEPTLFDASRTTVPDGIAVLANKAIRPGAVVIDIGAGDGTWSKAALAAVGGIEVHCFEPNLSKYRQLLLNLAPSIATGQVIPHNATFGELASWKSLADYAKTAGLNRLPFVRLGAGIPVTVATDGCEDFIRHGHLEFILATADVDQEKSLAGLLLPHRYELFRHPALGNQLLCTSDRFRSTIKNEAPSMPDVLELCREFGVTPRGVVHVGAHEGHEARRYSEAGISNTVMVEANPAVYMRLQENVADLPGVITINCAAGDQNGTIELRVTNADQSSSILPLARHSAIYPSVRQTSVVQVPARTVDQILRELGQNQANYNLLNLDIQGAELLALKGAVELLPNVQAILTEVNYEELYAGCATIEEMDAILEAHGFDRVATTTPYHASWGDAFYVRRRTVAVPKSPTDAFLHDARNTLVQGWLSLSTNSLREAWEGATGHAHRHLIENGVHSLRVETGEEHRLVQLLQTSLNAASRDRRLQLLFALMLYLPMNQIAIPISNIPGWLKKSLGILYETREVAAA